MSYLNSEQVRLFRQFLTDHGYKVTIYADKKYDYSIVVTNKILNDYHMRIVLFQSCCYYIQIQTTIDHEYPEYIVHETYDYYGVDGYSMLYDNPMRFYDVDIVVDIIKDFIDKYVHVYIDKNKIIIKSTDKNGFIYYTHNNRCIESFDPDDPAIDEMERQYVYSMEDEGYVILTKDNICMPWKGGE